MARKEPSRVKDPICGKEIEIALASAVSHYKGLTYYFCSEECKKCFEEEFGRYLEETPKGYSH